MFYLVKQSNKKYYEAYWIREQFLPKDQLKKFRTGVRHFITFNFLPHTDDYNESYEQLMAIEPSERGYILLDNRALVDGLFTISCSEFTDY